jgi:hypothetical protein
VGKKSGNARRGRVHDGVRGQEVRKGRWLIGGVRKPTRARTRTGGQR